MAQRLPSWLKKRKKSSADIHAMKTLLRKRGLNTVCESARCPNIFECFSKPTATFMILGDICTRECVFCSVKKGVPSTVQEKEPQQLAKAVDELRLKHVVITSVTRDDLPDGGSGHFAITVQNLKKLKRDIIIEVLTPDFQGREESIRRVICSKPDIYNHNIETVSRLYRKVRPRADYKMSLSVFQKVKSENPVMVTKSGFMVGLGESIMEVVELLKELSDSGCDMVTIGQYLRPGTGNFEVSEYIHPDTFERYAEEAKKMGFKSVSSAPFVRSSYNAETAFSPAKKYNMMTQKQTGYEQI